MGLLDIDLYKLTMGNFVLRYYPNIRVGYKLINRSLKKNILLYVEIGKLREKIYKLIASTISYEEESYLRSLNLFSGDFIKSLKNPSKDISMHIEVSHDGTLDLRFEGPWFQSILFETQIMAIISELYFKGYPKNLSFGIKKLWKCIGETNLCQKLTDLSFLTNFKFVEYGTRRRFSKKWHERVVKICKESKSFLGTSNVELAMKNNVTPVGTMGHELFMVVAQIFSDSPIHYLQNMMKHWLNTYGYDYSIMLPDTFGSRFFIEKILTIDNFVFAFKGLRHDSGSPIEFFYLLKEFFTPSELEEKTFIFSDALNVEKIKSIHYNVYPTITPIYAWGTDLTNDVGFKPLNIIIKPSYCIDSCGFKRYVCKLSDEPNKTTGSLEKIRDAKKLFDYDINPLYKGK